MSRSRSKTPKPASDQPRIFVDVRLSDGMDGGLMVREILEKLGARVLRSWAGTRAKATHLVWKDGDARTQEEARNCGAAVVGLSWVNACRDVNGIAPTRGHEIAPAARSTARAFLIQRELATTARKRRQTPRAPDTARLRAEDLPGSDDPRFRSTTSGERTPAIAPTAPWSDGSEGDPAPRTVGVVEGTPAVEAPRTAIREAWSFTQRDRRSSGAAAPTQAVSSGSGARRSSAATDIYSQSGTEAAPTQPTQPQPPPGTLFSPPAEAPAPAPTTRGSRTSAAGGAANLLLSARDRYWDDEPSARRRARGRRATRGSLAPDPTLRLDARLEAASQESSRPRSGATARSSLTSPPAPAARKRRRAVGGTPPAAAAPGTTPAARPAPAQPRRGAAPAATANPLLRAAASPPPAAAAPAPAQPRRGAAAATEAQPSTANARSRKRRRVIPDEPADATPAPRDVIVIDGSPEEAPAADPAPPPARRRGAAVAAPPHEVTTNPLLRAAASPPPTAPAPASAPAQPRRGAAAATEAQPRRGAARATTNPMHGRDSPTANRTRRRSRGIDDDEGTRPAKRQQTLVISASGVDPAGRTALRAAAAAVERAGGGKARFAGMYAASL